MRKFLFSILSPLKSPLLLLLFAWVYYASISIDVTGDLGRIGQIVFSNEYRIQEEFQHIPSSTMDWGDVNDLKSNSVVFIGDSFTKSTSYPDYLANIFQIPSVKFFADNTETPEETFIALCNANYEMPKAIVLESVEREFVFHLCNVDFCSSITPRASVYTSINEKQTDFSTFYKNKLFNNHAVLNVSLRDSLFTCPQKEKELYFYKDDLRFPKEEQIQTAISNLESLFQLAKKKNICLFYVVAADKYDVYQEFAVDNSFPKKYMLDRFIGFESNLYFVNTKHVLLKNANQGVKDLYYADDTHWSPVGAKIVAEEIARRMDSLGVFQP